MEFENTAVGRKIKGPRNNVNMINASVFHWKFSSSTNLEIECSALSIFFLQTVEPFYVPYTSQVFFSKKILPQKIFLRVNYNNEITKYTAPYSSWNWNKCQVWKSWRITIWTMLHHSSLIRGLRPTKCYSEMLQNL